MATHSFPVPSNLRPQLQPYILICLLDHADEAPLVNIKMESQRWPEKPISEKVETQYVAMVTKLLSSYYGGHLQISS